MILGFWFKPQVSSSSPLRGLVSSWFIFCLLQIVDRRIVGRHEDADQRGHDRYGGRYVFGGRRDRRWKDRGDFRGGCGAGGGVRRDHRCGREVRDAGWDRRAYAPRYAVWRHHLER